MTIEYKDNEYWHGLLDRHIREMTEEESQTYLQCLSMEMDGFCKGRDSYIDKGLEESLGYQIFTKRLEAAGTEVTLPLAMFLVSLCDSPGKVVLWAYTVQVIKVSREIEGRPVKMEDLAEVFPWGFPTEKGYEEAWEEQKKDGAPHGNMVDDFRNWPGVVLEEPVA